MRTEKVIMRDLAYYIKMADEENIDKTAMELYIHTHKLNKEKENDDEI